MATAKKQTKADLENKIAELEAKLNKLSTQLDTKPAEVKPAETKPAPAKPAERPAATTKPKGTLPKGFEEAKPAETKPAEVKPAETKPAERPAATTKPKGTLPKGFEAPAEEVPQTADTTAQPPSTAQEALENAYYTAPMTSFHDYRAKVTGYSPAPNRYFVRRTAPVGKVPTRNWNDQKATVTGYTACSDQYYATRARIAHHPADKTFGGFSGVNMTFEGLDAPAQQTQQAPPPEAPKPAKGTLPKGMGDAPPQQATSSDDGKSRAEKLAEYEEDYLKRIEQQRIDEQEEFDKMLEEEAKARATANRGTLPKGFEPKPEPEEPKASRGTLPKGF